MSGSMAIEKRPKLQMSPAHRKYKPNLESNISQNQESTVPDISKAQRTFVKKILATKSTPKPVPTLRKVVRQQIPEELSEAVNQRMFRS